MTNKALCKKLSRKFKVGDMVTWGVCAVSCRVLEVKPQGLIVEPDGYFVPFIQPRGMANPRHADE